MKDEKGKALNEKELEEVNGGLGDYGLGKIEFKNRYFSDPNSSSSTNKKKETTVTNDPYPSRAPR